MRYEVEVMTRKDYTAIANAFVRAYKERDIRTNDVNSVLSIMIEELGKYDNFNQNMFRDHIIAGLNA